jgi:hypothetical protein
MEGVRRLHVPREPRMLDGDPAPDIALPSQLMRSAYVMNMFSRFCKLTSQMGSSWILN